MRKIRENNGNRKKRKNEEKKEIETEKDRKRQIERELKMLGKFMPLISVNLFKVSEVSMIKFLQPQESY